jgi:hypothetical protein
MIVMHVASVIILVLVRVVSRRGMSIAGGTGQQPG